MHIKNKFLLSILIIQPFTLLGPSMPNPMLQENPPAAYYYFQIFQGIVTSVPVLVSFYWQYKDRKITQRQMKAQAKFAEGQCSEQETTLQRTKTQYLLELYKLADETKEDIEKFDPKKVKKIINLEKFDPDDIMPQYLRSAWNTVGEDILERLKQLNNQKKTDTLNQDNTKESPSYSVKSIKPTGTTEQSNQKETKN